MTDDKLQKAAEEYLADKYWESSIVRPLVERDFKAGADWRLQELAREAGQGFDEKEASRIIMFNMAADEHTIGMNLARWGYEQAALRYEAKIKETRRQAIEETDEHWMCEVAERDSKIQHIKSVNTMQAEGLWNLGGQIVDLQDKVTELERENAELKAEVQKYMDSTKHYGDMFVMSQMVEGFRRKHFENLAHAVSNTPLSERESYLYEAAKEVVDAACPLKKED